MNAIVKPRSSADVRADLERFDAERTEAAAALGTLDAMWNEVLLSGDDERAEEHELEAARQRRTIARADLRRPPLEQELARAQEREAAEEKANLQAEANALVDAVLGDVEKYYAEPARKVAAFLERWQEANAVAKAAGVPCCDARARVIHGHVEPARDEEYPVWIDGEGREVDGPREPGAYLTDPRTGELVSRSQEVNRRNAARRRIRKARRIPEKRWPDTHLGGLEHAVTLPGATKDEPPIWPAADQR